MLGEDVRVGLIKQRMGEDGYGNPVRVLRIEFKVGGRGPFSVDVEQGKATRDTIDAAIEKVADVVRTYPPPASA